MGQQCLYVVAVMVVVVGEENLCSSEKTTFFFFFLRSDNVQGGCFYKHNGIQDEWYDQFKKRSIGMYSTWQRIYQLKCTVGGDGEATFNSGFSHRRRNVPEGGWEGDNYQVPWDNKERQQMETYSHCREIAYPSGRQRRVMVRMRNM